MPWVIYLADYSRSKPMHWPEVTTRSTPMQAITGLAHRDASAGAAYFPQTHIVVVYPQGREFLCVNQAGDVPTGLSCILLY
jgi:hypothetical protein